MDGYLVIDKKSGYTSRDIVNIVGKIYHTKKVGHTGTLDPLATGVLVVCINKGTKVVELLTALDKEYIAIFKFGTLTDTLDIEGNILKEEKIIISEENIKNALTKIEGEYEQEVPIYSAVKVGGKKLYEYAREGLEIELPKHHVNIKKLELLKYEIIDGTTYISVKANVSKGTYIRSLGNDIAKILGTNAIMTSLRRTKQGEFTIDEAIKLDDLNSNTKIYPLIDCLSKYNKVIADKELENDILDGKILDNKYNTNEVLFVDNNNNVIALYEVYDKDNTKIKPWKMFKNKL